ncbi:unnamed protein product [Ixodes persulcatus]
MKQTHTPKVYVSGRSPVRPSAESTAAESWHAAMTATLAFAQAFCHNLKGVSDRSVWHLPPPIHKKWFRSGTALQETACHGIGCRAASRLPPWTRAGERLEAERASATSTRIATGGNATLLRHRRVKVEKAAF